jgi:transposase InsO family protein
MDSQNYRDLHQILIDLNTSTHLTFPHLTLPQFNQLQKQSKFFILDNNLLYKVDRRNINNLLRVIRKHEVEPVLYMFHNDPTAAHLATDTMFDKIRSRYYWPQMYETIHSYVQSCDSCQRRGRNKKNQTLHPIPVGTPFHQIGIDFVGPLPTTAQGNRYILVAMDRLTKWPEAKPVPDATAAQVATFLYDEIIMRHGCPAEILSDRGSHFKNNMIKLLLEKFSIRQKFSTPYHPQTNGLVERFNRTLVESLARLQHEHKGDWDLYIAPTLFAYRTSKHSTTRISPFFLVYGREAKLPLDSLNLEREHNLLSRIGNLIDDLPENREIAKQHIEIAQYKQKEMYDRHINKEQHFQIGQKVLYFKAAQDQQRTGKLLPKWKGPYFIHEIQPHGSYKLRTLDNKLLKSPINGSLLKQYYERCA